MMRVYKAPTIRAPVGRASEVSVISETSAAPQTISSGGGGGIVTPVVSSTPCRRLPPSAVCASSYSTGLKARLQTNERSRVTEAEAHGRVTEVEAHGRVTEAEAEDRVTEECQLEQGEEEKNTQDERDAGTFDGSHFLESNIDSDEDIEEEISEPDIRINPDTRSVSGRKEIGTTDRESRKDARQAVNDDKGNGSKEESERGEEEGEEGEEEGEEGEEEGEEGDSDEKNSCYFAESIECSNAYISATEEDEEEDKEEDKEGEEEEEERDEEDEEQEATEVDNQSHNGGKSVEHLGLSLIARELLEQNERERELRGRWRDMGLDLPDSSTIDDTSFTTYQLPMELLKSIAESSSVAVNDLEPHFTGARVKSQAHPSLMVLSGDERDVKPDCIFSSSIREISQHAHAINSWPDVPLGQGQSSPSVHPSIYSESDSVCDEEQKEEENYNEKVSEASTEVTEAVGKTQDGFESSREKEQNAVAEVMLEPAVEELDPAEWEDCDSNRPYMPTVETPIEREMRETRERELELRQTRNFSPNKIVGGWKLGAKSVDLPSVRSPGWNSVTRQITLNNSKRSSNSEKMIAGAEQTSLEFDAKVIASAKGALRKVPNNRIDLSTELSAKDPVASQVHFIKSSTGEFSNHTVDHDDNLAEFKLDEDLKFQVVDTDSTKEGPGMASNLNSYPLEAESFPQLPDPTLIANSNSMVPDKSLKHTSPGSDQKVKATNTSAVPIKASESTGCRGSSKDADSLPKQMEGIEETVDRSISSDAILTARNKLKKISNNKWSDNSVAENCSRNITPEINECRMNSNEKLSNDSRLMSANEIKQRNNIISTPDKITDTFSSDKKSVDPCSLVSQEERKVEQEDLNVCTDVISNAKNRLKQRSSSQQADETSKENQNRDVSVEVLKCNLSHKPAGLTKGRVFRQISKLDKGSKSFDSGTEGITKHNLKRVTNRILQEEINRDKEREQELKTESKNSADSSQNKHNKCLARQSTVKEIRNTYFQCNEFPQNDSRPTTSSQKPLIRSRSMRSPRSAGSPIWVKENQQSSSSELGDWELLKKFASKRDNNMLTCSSGGVTSPTEFKIKQELNDLLTREKELRIRQACM